MPARKDLFGAIDNYLDRTRPAKIESARVISCAGGTACVSMRGSGAVQTVIVPNGYTINTEDEVGLLRLQRAAQWTVVQVYSRKPYAAPTSVGPVVITNGGGNNGGGTPPVIPIHPSLPTGLSGFAMPGWSAWYWQAPVVALTTFQVQSSLTGTETDVLNVLNTEGAYYLLVTPGASVVNHVRVRSASPEGLFSGYTPWTAITSQPPLTVPPPLSVQKADSTLVVTPTASLIVPNSWLNSPAAGVAVLQPPALVAADLPLIDPTSAGTYLNANVVIDGYGRVVHAQDGSPPTSGSGGGSSLQVKYSLSEVQTSSYSSPFLRTDHMITDVYNDARFDGYELIFTAPQTGSYSFILSLSINGTWDVLDAGIYSATITTSGSTSSIVAVPLVYLYHSEHITSGTVAITRRAVVSLSAGQQCIAFVSHGTGSYSIASGGTFEVDWQAAAQSSDNRAVQLSLSSGSSSTRIGTIAAGQYLSAMRFRTDAAYPAGSTVNVGTLSTAEAVIPIVDIDLTDPTARLVYIPCLYNVTASTDLYLYATLSSAQTLLVAYELGTLGV